MNWQENQDSSLVERQATDLEVRVQVPVQIQIFLLKFNSIKICIINFFKEATDIKINSMVHSHQESLSVKLALK